MTGLPRVKANGSLIKPPSISTGGAWKTSDWTLIQLWDIGTPNHNRFIGVWNAPSILRPMGFSVSHGVFFYEDINGYFRRVHWYDDGKWRFMWFLNPAYAKAHTVLKNSLEWSKDWVSLESIEWDEPEELLALVYNATKA